MSPGWILWIGAAFIHCSSGSKAPNGDLGADASSLDAPGMCPSVAQPPPDPDPWSIEFPGSGPAVIRQVTSGTHNDLYLSGPSGIAELGIRLDWGGAVVFFGQPGAPGSNTIDANDTGRELQIALYDPQRASQSCAATATCAGANPCGNSITYLGWDPVQGGDECNHGARVIDSGARGDRMFVSVRPVQWNPDWAATDCRMTACGSTPTEAAVTYNLSFRFVHTNVVEISMEIVSSELFGHEATEQEFPTLYVSHGGAVTDLPVLLDAAGTAIAIDQPANDGFTYRNFMSPEPWTTWQQAAHTYGIGLGMDNGVTAFQAWAGDGQHAAYFHNVRAIQAFGIPAGGIVRGRSYIALGDESTVGSLLGGLLAQRHPFGALDAPPAGVAMVGAAGLDLSGWVLDNRDGVTTHARIAGTDVATLALGDARPDVCATYPNYRGCPSPGFRGNVPIEAFSRCPALLEVYARDSDGNETVIGRRLAMAQ